MAETKAGTKRNSLLTQETWVGVIARVITTLFLMATSLLFAIWMNTSFIHEPPKMVMVAFLAMVFPMVAAVVVSELPRGTDWLMLRVGLATFCRTGLPLLIVIYCNEAAPNNMFESAIGFMAFFYIFGLTMSVWMSIIRVSGANTNSEAEHAIV